MSNEELMRQLFQKAALECLVGPLKDLWPEVKMSNKHVDDGVPDLSPKDNSVKLRMIPEYVAVLDRLDKLDAQMSAIWYDFEKHKEDFNRFSTWAELKIDGLEKVVRELNPGLGDLY